MDISKSPLVTPKIVHKVKNAENKLTPVTLSDIITKPGNKNNISTVTANVILSLGVSCTVNRNITDEANIDVGDHIRKAERKKRVRAEEQRREEVYLHSYRVCTERKRERRRR